MNREFFRQFHAMARKGCLGSLAMSVTGNFYVWFLREVYDLRFPHIGDDRHALNRVRSFDNLAGGFRSRRWLRVATGRRAA